MVDVPRGTHQQLERLATLVIEENGRQSLISPASVPMLWYRHIEDSLQLLRFGPGQGEWIDIGSGAGFPGLVVAIASSHPVVLIEPRKLRADFLRRAADDLALANVEVLSCKVEAVRRSPAAVISARAVASLGTLLGLAHQLSNQHTTWVLPKGRSAEQELASAQESWQGRFTVEPSLTDPSGGIVVATGVRRRAGRR